MYTLSGNFDLQLTPACTLSCKGCSTTDYMSIGNTICNLMTRSDLEQIVNNLIDNKLKVETLTFLGGEPTIHPNFLEFVKYLHTFKGVVYDKLILHSNATNITDDFLESLEYFDILKISTYPVSVELKNEIIKSGLYDYFISKNVEVLFRHQFYFYNYGVEDENHTYTQELNWERCFMKDSCRVITPDKIYRCALAYNERKEGVNFTDRQSIINYIENQNKPLDLCKTCPFPPKVTEWGSNHNERDKKNVDLAIQKIRNITLPTN